ncbi:hypothetical protein OQ496_11685 [Acetobacter suratthaniensis]|uniref:Uracil-DNA glycosylase-like domain-containing protein n=1 Tax=Acetobacter suratthaniensis TaxID=1502841 RepID=A0ABS3LNP1_9PROT|nr:hypothetical protein [Acetobacter suratthaniensis]MBO1328970.1 hypothetical protein [Acetobacter suratthaniensis]MCX2567112.1 hypothetical protein [Acetobacter suratthaniensis]
MLFSDRHDVIFPGWDSGDPGSPEQRSIWLYGIEPGFHKKIDAINTYDEPITPDRHNNTVHYQWDIRKWPFNRKALMLIAVIEGMPVTPNFTQDARRYAGEHKIFERNGKGYFKGNLFPQQSNNTGSWSDRAIEETGFQSKSDFYDFFRDYFGNLHRIVVARAPRLFIGVGLTHADDFAKVVFGQYVRLEQTTFEINGHRKKILLADGPTPLAVIPHLTGGSHGLNSYKSIQTAGAIIRNRFRL